MLKHKFANIILRKYDIRGIIEESLTTQDAFALGGSFVQYLMRNSLAPTIAVLKDARSSGDALKSALIDGIVYAGGTAVDCGLGPTPLCYFASTNLGTSGFVVVTGSHNPLNYNGFKFGIKGKAFTETEIFQVASIAENGIEKMQGGSITNVDVSKKYTDRLMQDFTDPKNVKFGFNALNGAGGKVLQSIQQCIGGEIFEYSMDQSLKTVLDPSNDQNIKRMQKDLKTCNLDIIFAFDGDADRVMAVTKNKVLYGEDILLLCIREVLSKEKGKVIFDVKCSNTLAEEIIKYGGEAIMYKTGHSLIKKKMLEEGAILAGECSGHIYFKQGYYGFDDGIYTAIRLLSYFARNDFTKEMDRFPVTVKSPEIKISCINKFDVIAKLQQNMQTMNIPFNDIDGVRANYLESSWFLVRASNTEEVLIVRYESKIESEFTKVKDFVEDLLAFVVL
ncbi:MAG: phosphomannomutase [Candidatus Deianiraeaceae bacterium]|jgi:phosphomannomutase